MKQVPQIEESRRAALEPLVEAIRRHELILFVGGGISQNLGLPDFKELVRHIAGEMDVNDSTYSLADYSVIAEAYVSRYGRLGALRSWMDTTWHPTSIDVSRSAVHNLIVDLDFPIIYTTNYDRWLEAAFVARGKPFRKVVSVADLAKTGEQSTEIIKFHGDFEDDTSLVLTEASYFQRMSFESPLDIRLRADSLARPLLFLGYSLHDINTRYLLFRLQELWRKSTCAEQRAPSYIFMTQHDTAQEIVLRTRGIEPLVWQDPEPGRATRLFLEALVHMTRPPRTRGAATAPARASKSARASSPRRSPSPGKPASRSRKPEPAAS